MKSKILNSIGLFLSIIGVCLLFYWAPPQPSFTTGSALLFEDNTPIDSSGKTVADENCVFSSGTRYSYTSME